jgi:hypothetical protein
MQLLEAGGAAQLGRPSLIIRGSLGGLCGIGITLLGEAVPQNSAAYRAPALPVGRPASGSARIAPGGRLNSRLAAIPFPLSCHP